MVCNPMNHIELSPREFRDDGASAETADLCDLDSLAQDAKMAVTQEGDYCTSWTSTIP